MDKNIKNKGDKIISVDSTRQNFTSFITKLSKDKTIKYTVLDLFCGAGGLTTGLTKAGLNVVAGIDINSPAIKTYALNHEHVAICKDLKKFSPEDFSKETKITNVDIIVGGPPCQGFSMAGKRISNDPRNSLFMEFVKYIEYFSPKAFMMENVIGILSMKQDDGTYVIETIKKNTFTQLSNMCI